MYDVVEGADSEVEQQEANNGKDAENKEPTDEEKAAHRTGAKKRDASIDSNKKVENRDEESTGTEGDDDLATHCKKNKIEYLDDPSVEESHEKLQEGEDDDEQQPKRAGGMIEDTHTRARTLTRNLLL